MPRRYAPGYAQVIDSPEHFQITPMSIDTWNRDRMPLSGPGAGRFVPGPVPRASLAPSTGPDAIYSGLLECPLTTRIVKTVDSTDVLRAAGGVCGAGGTGEETIAHAAECFAKAALTVGAPCVQASVSDPSKPPGCSVVADQADGHCHVYFNKLPAAQAAECGAADGVRRAGSGNSLVKLGVSTNATHANLTIRGPPAVWLACACMRMHAHACARVRMRAHTYASIHTHTWAHTHTHTHTRTPYSVHSQVRRPSGLALASTRRR